MWNRYTSVNDQEVKTIKNILIESEKISQEDFCVQNNLKTESGATHYPVVLIVDSSEEKTIAKIIEVVSDIMQCKDRLSDAIDIAIVDYSNKSTVYRKFSYLEENIFGLKNIAEFCPSLPLDSRFRDLGSALFLAWYISELRLEQYKNAGIDYKQPVFILISSFTNTDNIAVDGRPLLAIHDSWMEALLADKQKDHKLGIVKVPINPEYGEYYTLLKGEPYDKDNLGNILIKLFAMLISPIAASEESYTYLDVDEDSTKKTIEKWTAEKLKDLQVLFDDEEDNQSNSSENIHSKPQLIIDSSGSMSSNNLSLDKELDELANALYGENQFIGDESGLVCLADDNCSDDSFSSTIIPETNFAGGDGVLITQNDAVSPSNDLDSAAEARRKLRERILGGDLKEDERGHIAPSYNNISMNDDVAAEERRKLREALLRGDNNVIITHNGDAKPHKDDIFQYANDSTYIQIPKGKLAGGIENERCIQCGAIIWRGNKYCPECGAKQFWKTKTDFNISRVNFSATAPRKLSREAYNIIHLIVYEDEYRSVVNGIVHDKEIPQREIPGGTAEIEDDSVVKIILKSPDFELYYEEERLWKRKYIDFAIPIMLPSELRKKQVMFQAVIYINNIIATRLSFVVKCNSFRTQKISISREDILSAFISYASQDRSKAALIIQGMRKARPDMDIFFDVETLRSGEKWEDAIHQEIRNRDILYLFWSNYAKKSKWVDTEWRYAYSINGEDGIEPMPLEPAWSCPPPDELKNMHFNDNLLYIINQNPPTLKGMIQSQMSDLEEETIIDKDYLIKKMTELKELLEIGLYTPDEYEADRKALLEIYRKQQPF